MDKEKLEVKDYIYVHDNAMPFEALSSFLLWINTLTEFGDAEIFNGGEVKKIKEIRDVQCFSLPNRHPSKTLIHWQRVLVNLFKKALVLYREKHSFVGFNLEEIRSIEILKYYEGNHFTLHTDHAAKEPRTMSIIFLLNNDYEGGELAFTSPNGKHEFVVENKPNRLVLFPSNFLYPHVVKPVKKGIRYSVVSWVL